MRNQLLPLYLVVGFQVLLCEVPPKTPPEELQQSYSMRGAVPIEYFYVDDTNRGESTNFSFSEKYISKTVLSVFAHFQKINTSVTTSLQEGKTLDDVIKRFRKEDWIYVALRDIAVRGKRVVVIGATSPWLECLALALGAAEVTTIEYNNLTYHDGRLTTVNKYQFDEFYSAASESFDVAISMSSFDHAGLGRYGDALDPDADIASMQRVKGLLRPSGLLIFSVPIGPDVTVFNLHRRYGKVRLPLLLSGYEVIRRYGWDEMRLDTPANWRQTYEPIFVLGKPAPPPSETCASDT